MPYHFLLFEICTDFHRIMQDLVGRALRRMENATVENKKAPLKAGL
jgi:hypothetical protein